MLSFSRKTDLAILVLTALAQSPRAFVSVRALARDHHLPYRFASQIAGQLARAGLLEAREGVHGGYRLAREPSTLTLHEVVGVMEGPAALVACVDPRKNFRCPQKAWCTAKRGIGGIHQQFVASLKRTTVADLLHAHAER